MPRKSRVAIVEQAVAKAPRLRTDQPIMVGVSGGRDSVALLHALVGAGYKQIIVCHLDHGLRAESDADAWFVAELAQRYELPFEADRVDTQALADEHKLSLEAAARAARYEFFTQVARAHWCPRLVLAHHADDQVETLLLNLFRGSGRAGLSAMRPLSVREILGARMELHRPLLGVWREEIAAYAKAQRLQFHEDASNTDPRFTRNRLRHDMVPLLEESFGREIKRALWRTADILSAEEEFLGSHTPPVQTELAVAAVRALPLALQRRVLHAWLELNEVADLGYDDVENVRALLGDARPAKVNLSAGRHARRRAGKLFVE
jgi:tRNA(Ile)-lysidine synthase